MAMISIITLTLLITIANFFKLARLKPALLINKVIWWTNCLITVNSIFLLGYLVIFPDLNKYLNQLAPFLVFYGPLVYFMILAYDQNEISRKKVLLHMALPLLLSVLFLILLICNWIGASFESTYMLVFRILTIGSTFFYTVLIAIENQWRKVDKSFKIFIVSILILLSCRGLILLFFNVYGNNVEASQGGLSGMIYGITLLASLLVYAYCVRFNRRNADLALEAYDLELPRYQKSTLSATDLIAYELKIIELMEKDRIYLKNELSLQELATRLKLPKHYLTQVLNVRMKQGYHQYINSLRVEHACQLMRSGTSCSLQEIAMSSGFNSTVTFNRAFKTFKQMSPSEYIAHL